MTRLHPAREQGAGDDAEGAGRHARDAIIPVSRSRSRAEDTRTSAPTGHQLACGRLVPTSV